jgi:hypothetical protein
MKDVTAPPEDLDLSLLSNLWWSVVGTEEASSLEVELRREAVAGHRLFDVDVVAVACRKLMKEVVYWLPGERLWAVVHLTWSIERGARWPTTETVGTWAEVVAVLSAKGRP